MSKYTTGEMAKLCNVSVRTVQYYDSRNILNPSKLSEGGRRLYSEEELQKLQIICFLRNVGLSINSIAELFGEENPENVIYILLEQQKKELREEMEERQSKLQMLERIERELKVLESFSVESINDIAYKMRNMRKLRKIRTIILIVGLLADIIEWATLILWIVKGIWLPFVLGLPVIIGIGSWVTLFYFKNVAYICPKCHKVFKPKLRDAFFANHTPFTRKLTCIECGHKGFCVETCEEKRR